MRTLVDLLKRFHADERGVFAVIFGLMAIVLVAFGGAAVDYTAVETARTRAQVALDSAALGLQPTIFNTPAPTSAALKASALALLRERLNDESLEIAVDTAEANAGNGTLHLEATVRVNTAFVALVGVPALTARIVSEATRKRLNLEVAMVLDNSGSMDQQSRMTNLKKAARCAMNVLFNAIEVCNDTRTENDRVTSESNIWIGIVPFTGFVNVGADNRTASWIDSTGLSSIANDNFDDDDNPATEYTGTVNRLSLYTQHNIAWRGCVEARPYPYDTNDTEPSAANPDTLFVPQWSPDTPETLSSNSSTTRYIPNYTTSNNGAGPTVFTSNTLEAAYNNNFTSDTSSSCLNKDLGVWEQVQTKSGCPNNYASSGNNARDTGKNATFESCGSAITAGTTTAKNWRGDTISPAATTMPASMADRNGNPLYPTCYAVTGQFTSTTRNGRYNLTRKLACRYFFSDRVRMERLCKYDGTTSGSGSPNDDCPTNALTPLTATKKTVLDAINAMSPQGYTNIHQGAIWGFHMLSATEPLLAKAYDAATSKVMIIMTDGENTIDTYDFGTGKARTMQAYGYPVNGRIFSTDYPTPSTDPEITAAMDSRALETCSNAKALGIAIYTIGLAAPNQKTIDLLTNCASDPSMAYFPEDSSSLTAIFKEIADQLANLRLSQ